MSRLSFNYIASIQPFGEHLAKIFVIDTTMNKNKWMITPEAKVKALQSLINLPIVGFGHDAQKAIGKIVDFEANNAIYAIAKIDDEYAWEKIKNGEWRYTSPRIIAFDVEKTPEGEIVKNFIFDHIAFVKQPAFNQAPAEVLTANYCDFSQVLTASLNQSHSIVTELPRDEKGEESEKEMEKELSEKPSSMIAESLREKYNINAENSKKSQFLWAPTDNFSDWKFPVKDNNGNYQKDLIEAAKIRFHQTSEEIKRAIGPKLARLCKRFGINIDGTELEKYLEEGEKEAMQMSEKEMLEAEIKRLKEENEKLNAALKQIIEEKHKALIAEVNELRDQLNLPKNEKLSELPIEMLEFLKEDYVNMVKQASASKPKAKYEASKNDVIEAVRESLFGYRKGVQ
ncbi:MAG: hypothetical protein QXG39_05085 [Candidatus Aenigmatarchaeota archaeon]